MEQKIKKIIKKIGDIAEKVSQIQVGESIPSIETDIILGEIRSLYEDVRGLQISAETEDSKAEATPETLSTPVTEQESHPINKPSGQVYVSPEKSLEEPAILADKYQDGKKFMNESLAEKGRTENISSKIHSKPIRNIGSAIGINDRFKLINDLFNGDKGSYENTINILDGASNFNEAFNYINSSFDWDMEEESVQLLLELVRRKFIVNQNE